jgi:hypothetical protein
MQSILDALNSAIRSWRKTLDRPPSPHETLATLSIPSAACIFATLRTFAQSRGISVYLRETDLPVELNHAVFNFRDGANAFSSPHHRVIAIRDDMTDPSKRVYLMLHELGHLLNQHGHQSFLRAHGEVFAELTPLFVFAHFGWPVELSHRYLSGYLFPDDPDLPLAALEVLPVADQLISAIQESPCFHPAI